ncbi:hypothetical protein GCM10007079_30260 [Nocardiopsis terrae]|uniref:Anti-sigma regulatory factor (Ser/Thr protein kinase) n=1 Tax=Nocardiopsis terrae TaxID=372655 RepID=A0ABR9HIK1_9ACTN|nr:anti-sigma regulatory factor (Ser/Thr protein kinase) [Nocardiopsis terrae]GHC86738.1 hypothetical protein GCM10007079_30260 [Nocardiopsis terrae]
MREARDWLRRRLDLACVPTPATDDALLITSELITNALLHSPMRDRGGAFFVSAMAFRSCLRVSVRTNGTASTAPHLHLVPAGPDSEHGRGLPIVNALSADWGVESTRRGQAVYFTLEWDPPRPPEPCRRTRALPHQRPADTSTWER